MKRLEQIEEKVDSIVGENYEKCMVVLLAFLELVKQHFPEEGLKAFESAKGYWYEGGEADSLNNIRVAIWQYLDNNKVPANPTTDSECAMRALICVLYPEPPSEDLGELTGCFFEFMDQMDIAVSTLETALKSDQLEKMQP